MKIYAPIISNQQIGGGYTFHQNFEKALYKSAGIELVSREEDKFDILFAAAPTLIQGEVIDRAKAKGAKFVLRIDGVPEDNRNSGRGTRRLIEYALKADMLIYQTEFVRKTLGIILRNNGVKAPTVVIYNGVDRSIFKTEGPKVKLKPGLNIAHVAYRKDNNKRYEEVLAWYRALWSHKKDVHLLLIGRYPTEWQDYNMGFFNGESYQRVGIVTDKNALAMYLRSCDIFIYPSFADPAPNVALEAMASGLPVLYNSYGGTKELVGHGGVEIDMENLVEQVADIQKKLQPLKDQASERADHFTINHMAESYILAFERALL